MHSAAMAPHNLEEEEEEEEEEERREEEEETNGDRNTESLFGRVRER